MRISNTLFILLIDLALWAVIIVLGLAIWWGVKALFF
jgi:hypothetical protein